MATYYIDWKNGIDSQGRSGSTSEPWKTIGYAQTRVSSGDTVRLRGNLNGTPGNSPADQKYREANVLSVPNITWIADTNHYPEIDGNYGPHLFANTAYKRWGTSDTNPNGPNLSANKIGKTHLKYYELPSVSGVNFNIAKGRGEEWVTNTTTYGSGGNAAPEKTFYYSALIRITGEGVTFKNIIVRNSCGRNILVSASGVTVEGCRSDFCWNEPLQIEGDSVITNVTIKNNWVTRGSYRLFDLNRQYYIGGGPESVSGSMRLRYTKDSLVEGNIIAFGGGEGLPGALGSDNITFRNNIIHTNHHVHMYMVGVWHSIWESNICYFCETWKEPLGQVDKKGVWIMPEGFVPGDEKKKGSNPYVSIVATNNLIVGPTSPFEIRANPPTYDMNLDFCYFGYNTFVGTKHRAWHAATNFTYEVGREHKRCLFENNITIVEGTVVDSSKGIGNCANAPNAFPGFEFRNNVWSDAQTKVPASIRGDNDVYNATNILQNPFASITTTVDIYSTDLPDPTATTFNVNNYKLKSNATTVIGKGAPHTALNGMTPSVTKDAIFFGAKTRTDAPGGKYDPGCYEADGAVGHTISAAFTVDVTSGVAPLTVAFNSSSSTSSGTITSRSWNWGDGTPAGSGTSPSHVFTTPGTYTVRLTIEDSNGLSDIAQQVITVFPPDTGGDISTGFAVVRQAAPTSGTLPVAMNFDISASDAVPVGALFFMSKATSAGGSATDGLMLGWGMIDATGRQAAGTFAAKDNSANSVVASHQRTDCALISIGDAGAITGQAVFGGVSANRVSLSCTDLFPSGYSITAVIFYGASAQVRVDNLSFGAVNSTVTVPAGFTIGALLGLSEFTSSLGNATVGVSHAFGVASSATNATSHVFQETHNAATADRRSWYSDNYNRFLRKYDTDSNRGQVLVNGALNNLKVDFAAVNDVAAVMQFGASMSPQVKPFTLSATTGVAQDFALDFDPALLIGVLTSTTNKVSYQNTAGNNDGLSYFIVTPSATYVIGGFSQDDAGTTNAGSYVEDSLKLKGVGGADIVAATVALGTNKFSITPTTGAIKNGVVLAFPAGSSTGTTDGPIPNFVADKTVVKIGEVITFDASTTNPNGSAVTSYQWEFGDGTTEEGVTVEKFFLDSGSFDVTLNAINANGTGTLTRPGYIVVETERVFVWPVIPAEVTNYSQNFIDTDPDSETFGHFFQRLNLDSLVIDSEPTDTTSEIPGKARFYWNDTDNSLYIRVNGKHRKIATTAA